MGLAYNILTDDVGFENYIAFYISIVGYKYIITDKRTGKVRIVRKYPNAKEALNRMGIKTNEK